MKMSLCAISPLVHPVSSLVFPSCLSALLYTTCLRLVVICRHLPIRNVNVDVLWMNEKAIRYYLSSSHRNICVYMCIHVWLQWYLWVCALIVFLCVHVSLSVHVHAHFQLSSARQSLQCDTNKCLDVSVSLSFSWIELSSHGPVVLRKTSTPIVPHKAPNADAAVAYEAQCCVCVRMCWGGLVTVRERLSLSDQGPFKQGQSWCLRGHINLQPFHVQKHTC